MEDVSVNELSFNSDHTSSSDGYALFTSFFSLCVEYARRVRGSSISVWSSRSIKSDVLCGITFRQWLAAHNRSEGELRSFALGLVVNQKVLDSYPEYIYGDRQCQGLAVAAEHDLLCLSFPSSGEWDVANMIIAKRVLNDVSDETEDDRLSVHHASTTEHLQQHRQWIETRITRIEQEKLEGITTAKEFWPQREILFPSLIFCQSTYSQLEEIFQNTHKLRGVLSKLRELNSVATEWDASHPFDHSLLRKATPESVTRKRAIADKLMIDCPDGISRHFVWHVRFTPDEGRIHYCPDRHDGRCYIGYIGPKIL